jgi:hypothetical protein
MLEERSESQYRREKRAARYGLRGRSGPDDRMTVVYSSATVVVDLSLKRVTRDRNDGFTV